MLRAKGWAGLGDLCFCYGYIYIYYVALLKKEMIGTCKYNPTFLNVGLVILAIVAIIVAQFSMSPRKDQRSRINDLRVIDNAADYVGLLLWPVIWNLAIGFEILEYFPFTFLGLVWPMVLIFMDLYAKQERVEPRGTSYSLVGNLQVNASAVITVAFSMGALLLSTDKSVSTISSPMIMFALLFTIAFVVPAHNLQISAPTQNMLVSIQNIFLNYAIGFVIAGISVNLSALMTHHQFYSHREVKSIHPVTKAPIFHPPAYAAAAAAADVPGLAA
jgi:hypothetical protein